MTEKKHVFIEDRIVQFLNNNRVFIVGLFLAIILATGGFYFSQWNMQNNQKAAFEEIYSIQQAHEAHLNKTFKKQKPSPTQWFESSKIYISQLENAFQAHPAKTATFYAVLQLAHDLKQNGKTKKSKTLISTYINQVPKDHFLLSLFYFFEGYLLEEDKNFTEALLKYDYVLSQETQKFSHPEALIRKAALYWGGLKQKTQAQQVLQTIIQKSQTDNVYKQFTAQAEAYLNLISLESRRKTKK